MIISTTTEKMPHFKDIKTTLGKQVSYKLNYDPALLDPIPRELGREAAGLHLEAGSWYGEDIWNVYELSWLSTSGKPEVAIAEIRVPAISANLIESKSLKLYFNSFNMSQFVDASVVEDSISRDLSKAAGAEVTVKLQQPSVFSSIQIAEPAGISIDEQALSDFSYVINPEFLTTADGSAQETLFSRLFRSCCPVTGQPDWATVTVSYSGRFIHHEGLLRYLVSYREHSGFHEACVERIFYDISQRCCPETLTVSARFTRRGGIDINPVRSTDQVPSCNIRDPRQ
jgi:7-cyano-7-deazaguanine reductase